MSFQSIITKQVALLTERLNTIANNAKKIVELPWQSVLRPNSEIHVSDSGTSYKIKIQQIFDWFNSVRQNQLLSANVSIISNNITVAAGAQWIIGNVNYATVSNTSFTIDYAETGFTRNDILVANKSNQIIRVLGPETAGISPTPPTPIDTVLVTIINVTDSTVGNTPPIIGGDYEKVVNKATNFTVVNDVLYPTIRSTKEYVDSKIASIVVNDATNTTKGITKLTGDLGGTADLPTTPTAIHKTGDESRTGNLSISNQVTPSALLLLNGGTSAGILSVINVSNFAAFTGTTGAAGTLAALNTTSSGTVLTLNSSSTGKLLSGLNNNTETSSLDKFGNLNAVSATFSGNAIAATPTASNHLVTKAYADSLVVGVVNLRGTWDASTNLFPTTGGSGTAGAVRKGDLWYVSIAGVLNGKSVNVGDSFFALINTPGQTSSSWNVIESNIGYVPADDSNVLHVTGDETFFGMKSWANTQTNPSMLAGSNNRTQSSSAAMYLDTTSYGAAAVFTTSGAGPAIRAGNISSATTGDVLYLTNNSNTAAALRVINSNGGIGSIFSTISGIGSMYVSSGSGNALVSNVLTGATGLVFVGQNNGTTTFTVDKIGSVIGKKFSTSLLGSEVGFNATLGGGSDSVGFNVSNSSTSVNSVGYSAVSGILNALGANFRSSLTGGSTAIMYEGVNAGITVFAVTSTGLINSKGISSITTTSRPFIFGASGASQNYGTFLKNNGSPLVYIGDANGSALGGGTVNDFAIANPNSGGHILLSTIGTGNVGIGTSTPTASKLQVGSSSTTMPTGYFYNPNTGAGTSRGLIVEGGTNSSDYSADFRNSSGNSLLKVLGNGNVGIGVNDPTLKFQIRSATNINLGFGIGEVNPLAAQINAYDDAALVNIPMELKASKFNFSVGNVGVGVNPDNSAKLQVNGTISTAGIVMGDSADFISIFDNMSVKTSRATDTFTDIGFGAGYAVLESFKNTDANYGTQRVTFNSGTVAGKMYVRVKNAGTWSAWSEK